MTRRPGSWWAGLGASLGLFLAAFAVRIVSWPLVLQAGRVYFFGNDAYYHLRRIMYTAANFPATLAHDPYVNYPHGGEPIWAPLFDVAMAALVRVFVGLDSPHAVEVFAALMPPVLGAGGVVLLYWVARRFFGATVALWSAVLLAFLPAHYWYSQLGFVDHHVAVGLLSVVFIGTGMEVFSRLEQDRMPPWWLAVGLGALIGVAFLTWPGCLAHVGILEILLACFVATRADPRAVARAAAFLAVSHAVALACVAPFCVGRTWRVWGAFSPAVLTNFQPLLLACITLFYAGLWGALGPGGLGWSRGRIAVAGAAWGLAIAAAVALLFPELRQAAGDAWQWLARAETFQHQVGESSPLFLQRGRLSVGAAEMRLSRLIYAVPVVLVALAWSTVSKPNPWPRLFFLGWCAGLLVLTMLQRRFFNSFSVAMAVLVAWAGRDLMRWATSQARARDVPAAVAWGAGLVILVVALYPCRATYQHHVANITRLLRGETLVYPAILRRQMAMTDAADWVRENTAPTSGLQDPDGRPEYGLLAGWNFGHLLKYRAQRPTVVGNFGDDVGSENFERALGYYALEDEDEAIALARELGVRYVLVGREQGRRDDAETNPRSMYTRLFVRNGAGLTRHRLVYETARRITATGGPDASIKVFEVLPASAEPGTP